MQHFWRAEDNSVLRLQQTRLAAVKAGELLHQRREKHTDAHFCSCCAETTTGAGEERKVAMWTSLSPSRTIHHTSFISYYKDSGARFQLRSIRKLFFLSPEHLRVIDEQPSVHTVCHTQLFSIQRLFIFIRNSVFTLLFFPPLLYHEFPRWINKSVCLSTKSLNPGAACPSESSVHQLGGHGYSIIPIPQCYWIL